MGVDAIQGAGETGVAEAYMCSRIMRDPLVRQCVAEYQGEFIADASDGGFTKGTQWLVWKFESDSTLGDALSVRVPQSLLGYLRACAHHGTCACTPMIIVRQMLFEWSQILSSTPCPPDRILQAVPNVVAGELGG